MAQNSGTGKFPAPIPHPFSDEEKTDPNLVIPEELQKKTTSSQLARPAQASTLPNLETTPPDASPELVAPATSAQPPAKMPEMGPLDALMKDPSITEIMVNDLRNVMIEKEGKLSFSGFSYQSIDELNRLTRNILDITGRILSPDQPYVDVMLPDGSRVNIVAPPLTLVGPCITIRKFPLRRLNINDLIASEMLDQRIAYFLNVCVVGKLNILISGGTGGGKTTVLNVLASFIPKKDRIITIEDTPELVIQHSNSVRLQTKPQTPTSGAVTARDLVSNSLRMRPDRIIVGECRRSEAFDMLQAMNTGHSGSMTTLHANSTRDALARLETLCMLAGTDLPIAAIRKQITSALDLIVQIKRFRDGKRRIVEIAEVTGMEGETILLQDIFSFESNLDSTGHIERGRFKVTGLVPTFLDRLRELGIEFPRNYFG
jgi:pilus assembly protein CpaF